MNRAEIKARAKALLKPQYGTVLLTVLIADIVVHLLESSPTSNFSSSVPAGTLIISLLLLIAALLVGGPLSTGAMKVYTNVTAGKTAKVSQLFDAFKTNFRTSVIANLIGSVIFALYALLLIVPGIMKIYSYSMVFYVLNKEPRLSAMEALHRSEDLMKGHRMELFKLHLSFSGWLLLVIVTFGLAIFWLAPYAQIAEVVFFDKIYENAR